MSGLTKASGGGGGGITIQEASGLPSILASILQFPDGSLTMNGTTVSVDKYPEPLSVMGPNLNSFAPYLRAGYTFGGTSGLADSVGVPHNMAAVGTPLNYLVAGHNNDAISWNSGGYFERPPQGFSPGTSEYTLNWWVKLPSISGTQTLLQWYAAPGPPSMALSYHYTGKLYFHDSAHNYSINTYPLNAWTMITWQRIKDGGVYYNRVFMNGVQEINLVDVTPDLESRSLRVGGTESLASNITGDELLYYTGPDGYGAISPAAILELYNSGTGIFLDTVGTPTGLGFSHADLVGYNEHLHDYWKFEESGTPLIDSISNNSLAATGSPTFAATGKNNNCIDFHSSTPDSLSRIATFAHTTTQEYTLSYWVYVDALGAIQHFHQFHTPGYTSMIEQVHIGTAGELYHYRKWWVGGADNLTITAPTVLTAASWHHIVVVKAQVGAVYQWSLYLDGAHQGSDTANASNTSQNTATSTFYVGRVGDATVYTLDGKIDELAYWKGVSLDSAGVTALFNAGTGRFLETI